MNNTFKGAPNYYKMDRHFYLTHSLRTPKID